jgi:HlyD family secretion protein
MAASENIFRKVALERLSSPEQLDRLITLTSPIGWAALAAIAVLSLAIIAWGIFGVVPTRVEGSGILVSRGGQVFDAMAPAAGGLASVAAVGTVVNKGDVVATLDDTQLDQDLLHANNALREQEEELAQLTARFQREIEARHRVDAQQRENLASTIATAQQRRAFYAGEIRSDEQVMVKGFLTRRFVQETRQQMEQAEQDEHRARNDLLRLDAEELDLTGRRDQEVSRQQEAVNAARRAVEELATRTERSTRIVSPITGHVTEVKATVGTFVAPGKSVVSIETAGKGLELVLYIPPELGKKVAPGMAVQIAPSTVKKEEYGTLVGHILDISEFPVSQEGMLAVLQNAQLVARFSAQGAPYAARVELVPDPSAPSGYAWSGGRGPPVAFSSGTTAAAEVTVHTQAPISLVLPLLRQHTGIGG